VKARAELEARIAELEAEVKGLRKEGSRELKLEAGGRLVYAEGDLAIFACFPDTEEERGGWFIAQKDYPRIVDFIKSLTGDADEDEDI
jgi:hypothetical protein